MPQQQDNELLSILADLKQTFSAFRTELIYFRRDLDNHQRLLGPLVEGDNSIYLQLQDLQRLAEMHAGHIKELQQKVEPMHSQLTASSANRAAAEKQRDGRWDRVWGPLIVGVLMLIGQFVLSFFHH